MRAACGCKIVYVSDDWCPGDSVTLPSGVRLTYQRERQAVAHGSSCSYGLNSAVGGVSNTDSEVVG